MVAMIMASYDALRSAISYSVYQLALNPTIQDKLTKEIKDYYDANPDSSLYDAVENIEYVDMVVHETLRMFITSPEARRECNETYAINNKLVIPKGTAIAIPFTCLHQNPEYWLNPDTFDPERFKEQSYPKFAYLSFGEGPRNCIGKHLALLVAKMCLVTMLKEFQFRKTDKTEVPLELTADITSNSKHGIYLSIAANPVC